MAPLVVSILIGVGVKVGLGLAASAAKKLMASSSTPGEPASFSRALKEAPAPSGEPQGAKAASVPASALPRIPYDLPGRLTAEGLHALALDVAAQRGVPSPTLTTRLDDPLIASRRIDQAP